MRKSVLIWCQLCKRTLLILTRLSSQLCILQRCKSIPSCMSKCQLLLFFSLCLQLIVTCELILKIPLVLVKMAEHIPVLLLHPVLACLVLVLNCLIQLISLNWLQLYCRVLILIKVQFSDSFKMLLNMLGKPLLLYFYLLVPVILNSWATRVDIVVVSLWSFALASNRVGVLGFDSCVQVFSIHSLESAFLERVLRANCLIVKILNFLLLRYR